MTYPSLVHLYGGGPVLSKVFLYIKDKFPLCTVLFITSDRLLPSLDSKIIADYASNVRIFNTLELYQDFLSSSTIKPYICSCGADTGFSNHIIQNSHTSGNIIELHPVPSNLFLGGAHESWMILNQSPVGGFSLQHINSPDISKCPFVYSETFSINEFSPGEIFDRSSCLGISLVPKIVSFMLGELCPTPIDISFSHSYPRLFTPTNGWINWSWSTAHIKSFIQCFSSPYPGASSLCSGLRLFLHFHSLINDYSFHPYSSGVILNIIDDLLYVATTDGILVLSFTFEDSAPQVLPGMRLHTPSRLLDQSLDSVSYGPLGIQ